MGEAAKRVPENYRAKCPAIPWRLMAGFRDILIHAYEGIDIRQVWIIASRDLPGVKTALLAMLPPLEQIEKDLAVNDSEDDSM